jgi:hypothetical protein
VCYNNEIMHTTQKNRKYHIVHLLEKQPWFDENECQTTSLLSSSESS